MLLRVSIIRVRHHFQPFASLNSHMDLLSIIQLSFSISFKYISYMYRCVYICVSHALNIGEYTNICDSLSILSHCMVYCFIQDHVTKTYVCKA